MAIELKPAWADPHFNLGFIYHKQGEFARAREEHETCLRLNPDLLEAQKMLKRLSY